MKSLNEKLLNKQIQLILLVVLSLFVIVVGASNLTGAPWSTLLRNIVNLVLVLGAVWLLFLSGFSLGSFAVLFLTSYLNGISNFVAWLLSLNVSTGTFGGFQWTSILMFLGALATIYTVFVLFVNEGFKLNRENFKLDQLMILFIVFSYFYYGLQGLLYVALIEIIAINYKKMASLLLMTSKVIIVLFDLIDAIVYKYLNTWTLYSWAILLLGLYVSFLLVMKIIVHLPKNESLKDEVLKEQNIIDAEVIEE